MSATSLQPLDQIDQQMIARFQQDTGAKPARNDASVVSYLISLDDGSGPPPFVDDDGNRLIEPEGCFYNMFVGVVFRHRSIRFTTAYRPQSDPSDETSPQWAEADLELQLNENGRVKSYYCKRFIITSGNETLENVRSAVIDSFCASW